MEKLYCVNIFGIMGTVKSIDMGITEEQFKSMTVKHLKDKISQTFPVTRGKSNGKRKLTQLAVI